MQSARSWIPLALVLATTTALHCSQFVAVSDDDAGAASSSSGSSSSEGGAGGSGQSGSSGAVPNDSGAASTGSSGVVEEEAGPPLDAFEQGCLDGFNAIRAAASPTPSPALPKLKWDHAKAATLRTFLESCTPGQPPVGAAGNVGYGSPNQTPAVIVSQSTDSNFDYATNTCTTGSCNAHRAVLARAVTTMACAIRDCSAQPPPQGAGDWELWVCIFDPASDPGQRPY